MAISQNLTIAATPIQALAQAAGGLGLGQTTVDALDDAKKKARDASKLPGGIDPGSGATAVLSPAVLSLFGGGR